MKTTNLAVGLCIIVLCISTAAFGECERANGARAPRVAERFDRAVDSQPSTEIANLDCLTYVAPDMKADIAGIKFRDETGSIYFMLKARLAGEDADAAKQLQWLDKADPVMDARAAIARGYLKFKVVEGYSRTAPGVPPEIKFERKDTELIRGTSDVLMGKDHVRLNSLATIYAEKYNTEIVRKLKQVQMSL